MEEISSVSKILKYILFIMAFTFVMPFFVACNESDIAVTDLKFSMGDELVMVQGDSVQLRYEIKPLEATNKLVKFGVADSTSDSYVTVDADSGILSAKVREDKTEVIAWVYVKSDYGNMSDSLKIKILGEQQTLSQPTNLRYDISSSSLVWNAVSETVVPYSPNYELKIEKDGQQLENETVNRNSFKLNQHGTYKVSVRSVVGDDAYKTIYADSSFSEDYEFEILPAPTEGKVENSKLIATSVDEAGVGYELHVFKIVRTQDQVSRGEEINSVDFIPSQSGNQILWTVPQSLAVGTYEFEIKTTSSALKIFPSIDFRCIQFEKLAVPSNIYLDADVLFWDVLSGATNYRVFVYAKSSGELVQTVENGFVKDGQVMKLYLNSLDLLETDYVLTLQAVGNGKEVLDSDASNVAVEKLSRVENFEISGNILSWNAVPNAGNYVIYLNGKNPTITDKTDDNYLMPISVLAPQTSCDVSNWNFLKDDELDGQSANIITIYAQASNIYGDSVSLSVHKLSDAVLKTIDGNVGWDIVLGAVKYEISVYDESLHKIFASEVSETSYSFSDDLRTRDAGKYVVTIRAIGNGTTVRDGDDVRITELNKEYYTFIKQSVPTIKGFSSDGVLTWARGANSLSTSTFEVGVFDAKQNTIIDTFNVAETSCDVNQYLVGQGTGVLNYQFFVRAINTQSKAKYLNSESTERLIAFKLNAPKNLRVSDGMFAWDEPDETFDEMKNLIGFKILINGTSEILQENYSQMTASPDASQMSPGDSNVQIKSYIKQDSLVTISNKVTIVSENVSVYVLNSEYTQAKTFTKLSTPTKPAIDQDSSSITYQRFVGAVVANAYGYGVTLDVDNNGDIGARRNYQTIETDADATNWSMSVTSLVSDGIDYGSYIVRVVALGGDECINSNISNGGVLVYKLDTPKVSVVNGVLAWNKVSSKLNNSYVPVNNYKIFYKKTSDINYMSVQIEGTSWDMAGIDAGMYSIKIQALGFGGAVVSSSESIEKPIQKLETVDVSSIKIDDHVGTSSNNYYLNTITWDKVDESSQYRLKIYQDLQDVTHKSTKTLKTNNFTFDDTYSANRYYITLQTLFENAVSGEETTPVYINRLNAVTGLSVSGSSNVVENVGGIQRIVSQNYKLSWNSVSNAASYAVSVNGKDFKTISASNDTSTYLIDNSDGLTSSQTGHLNIRVVAKIDAHSLEQVDGTLTISAPSSSVYTVYRNVAPTLNVLDGKINISNTNSADNNNGYTLIFTPTESNFDTVYIELPSGTTTYDMDDSNLAIQSETFYKVAIIAKGSNGSILQSEKLQFNQTSTSNPVRIGKLGSVNSIKVVNGEVRWDIVSRADGYIVSAQSDSSIIPVVTTNIKSSGTVVEMPRQAFSGLTGTVRFTVEPQGTRSYSGSVEAYITSDTLTEFSVQKLPTPTGLMVKNGEICWTLNDDVDYNTEQRKVSSYNVVYGSNVENVGFTNTFTLSDFVDENTTMSIQICAVGSLSGLNGGYVSSDYTSTSELVVEIGGKPIELDVVDGVLCWKEKPGDDKVYNDYELELVLDDAQQTVKTLLSAKNKNTLVDALSFGQDFVSIRVRHLGTTNSQTHSGIAHVNSQYSQPLYNVKKLSAITTIDVNNEGVLVWDHENADAKIALSLDETEFEATTNRSISNLVSNELELLIWENGYAQFTLSYYPTIENTRTSTDTPVYVAGEKRSFVAIKFAPVSNFKIENGLNISWSQDRMSINNVANDKVILSYQYSEYGSGDNGVDNQAWQEKTFNLNDLSNFMTESYSVPMWSLGYYNFKISVISSNSSVKVLRSFEQTILKTCFNKFSSGKGTAESPFAIKSTENNTDTPGADEKWIVEKTSAAEKFGYIKLIPSCFFRLEEDITLEDYTGNDLPYNNWTGDYDSVVLTGGISGLDKDLDENGNPIIHTIHHYCSYSGYGMFDEIRGGVNTELTSNIPTVANFYAQKGVLMNLKLEVSAYKLDTLTASIDERFASILVDRMVGGLLLNCEIYLGDDFGRDSIVINDSSSQPITFAPFVAEVYAAEEYVENSGMTMDSSYSYKNTVIKNCVSRVNVSILKNEANSKVVTKVAGIVGRNYGANIYNCKNTGNLSAVRVSGIALEASGMYTYEGNQYVKTLASAVISGCENTGTLNAYTINYDNVVDNSLSAGIIGVATNAFIINSINWGDITISPVESLYPNISSSGKSVAVVGGVVASFDAMVISGAYAGAMANCFNFGQVNFDINNFSRGELEDGPSFFGGIIGYLAPDKNISTLTSYYDSTKNTSQSPQYIRAIANRYITEKKDLTQLEIEDGEFTISSNEVIEDTIIIGVLTPNYYTSSSTITKNSGSYPTVTYI